MTTMEPGNVKRGYERLAAVMAWNPSLAMVPRFRMASTFNLLCLQAEIRYLEEDLEGEMRRNDRSDTDAKLYSINIDILRDHGKDSRQWKLVLDLRSKLEEYNKAIWHHRVIDDQASPSSYDYNILQNLLNSPECGHRDIRGAGAVAFLKPENGGCSEAELLVLNKSHAKSVQFRRIGSIILGILLRIVPGFAIKYRRFLPGEPNRNVYKLYGSHEFVAKVSDRIVTIFASMLILVPIIVLHFVTNPNWRLILILIFTLTSTVSMALLTDARRAEIFAAAAAIVAVQVVYVGSAS